MNRSTPKGQRASNRRNAGRQATASRGTQRRGAKLRIIAGSLRGRSVAYHGSDFTRPMKDSVRESLFNILGPRIRGADVFDLFAGTGAITFESVSRGAASAVAVEKNRHALRFLRSTAEQLSVTDRVRLLQGDAFRIGPGLLGPPATDGPLIDTPRIVFFCPPYALWESATEPLQSLIQLAFDHSPPGSLVVAETEKHQAESLLPPAAWDHRMYGNTRLSIVEPELRCGLRM